VELTNRTFEVEVTVPNPDGRLQPGAFARGSILTHTDENVLFVPKASVVTFAGVSKVFTVADGKAVDHRVKVGIAMDDQVEIVDGLKSGAGDVVVGGAAKLAAGTPVTAKPATQPAAATAGSRDP
jgi:membrane fusion protein (multidrug efflux system)